MQILFFNNARISHEEIVSRVAGLQLCWALDDPEQPCQPSSFVNETSDPENIATMLDTLLFYAEGGGNADENLMQRSGAIREKILGDIWVIETVSNSVGKVA